MFQWDAAIADTDLFDHAIYNRTASGMADIPHFKHLLARGDAYLAEQFSAGHAIKTLVYRRAWFIDQLLISAWNRHVTLADTALIAVGGYGRGELHPGSDIDLMVLIKSRRRDSITSQITAFLTFLWDTGLEVGQSVRTIRECVAEAKADITVATSMMESRRLTGSSGLYHTMLHQTAPAKIWPSRKFFEAKRHEQIERHKKFANTENNLEPNLKEGPGGLRDIQVIAWVAKRHFSAMNLAELVTHHFLTAKEYEVLDGGMQFLWRVRYALHLTAGRREDRLLFDHQRAVAKRFGYATEDNTGVEQFMKMYYLTVKELNLLNEVLLQHFQEEIIHARRRERLRPINKRFQIRNNFIEACHVHVFERYPAALLEIFLQMQLNTGIAGVRASTIRLIRHSLHLIDAAYRADIKHQSLFLEIIRQPHRVGHELRRMHKYGVLGAYLPAFARIEGLMQFDLFHVYTVDEHILAVVRYMRYFGLPEYQQQFPLCGQLLQQIPKLELLYLAGVFHDIAKGRGGDHSMLGSRDALAFCRAHAFSEFDAKLVAWLVERHLLMSMTAQRQDLNDPDVINAFAEKIGDVIHLNYLYLLTVADINGTNPSLWSSWKDALLLDLYHKTRHALRRGLEHPIDKEERIAEVKRDAVTIMHTKPGRQSVDAESTWSHMSDDYFLRYSADEIAWHTRAISKINTARLPLILIREKPGTQTTEIFIYMLDNDNIFSHIASTLDKLNLNILDARIITSTHGYTLDTFIFVEHDGSRVTGQVRKKHIKSELRAGLLALDEPVRNISRMTSRRLKNFRHPVRVDFSVDESNGRNIMEVSATEMPGFLSVIGMALECCGARLQNAKIATYGERVEDIFFITDRKNQLIDDPLKLECLKNSITQALAKG